ncbi:MAG: GNAT family N-acetyltransferase [Clostridia bacterium]|nr:GNAT family N-acetyltransferase [Clostridia bacterium]
MIRLLTPDEASAHRYELCELFFECKAAGSLTPPDIDFCRKKVDEMIDYLSHSKAYCFAYCENNELLGFAWTCKLYDGEKMLMHILYSAVSKNHRGKGIGSLLLSKCDETAKSENLSICELNVSKINPLAAKLYMKLGYKIHRDHEDHITLRKEL